MPAPRKPAQKKAADVEPAVAEPVAADEAPVEAEVPVADHAENDEVAVLDPALFAQAMAVKESFREYASERERLINELDPTWREGNSTVPFQAITDRDGKVIEYRWAYEAPGVYEGI